jgi:hypothetical protein
MQIRSDNLPRPRSRRAGSAGPVLGDVNLVLHLVARDHFPADRARHAHPIDAPRGVRVPRGSLAVLRALRASTRTSCSLALVTFPHAPQPGGASCCEGVLAEPDATTVGARRAWGRLGRVVAYPWPSGAGRSRTGTGRPTHDPSPPRWTLRRAAGHDSAYLHVPKACESRRWFKPVLSLPDGGRATDPSSGHKETLTMAASTLANQKAIPRNQAAILANHRHDTLS